MTLVKTACMACFLWRGLWMLVPELPEAPQQLQSVGYCSLFICLGQVHANIRAEPAPEKKERGEKPSEKQKWKQSKLTYEERKANLKVHIQGQ